MLLEDGEWALYGQLIEQPLKVIEMHEMMTRVNAQQNDRFDEEMRKHIQNAQSQKFATDVGTTVAALLAAGRDEDAGRVADRAMEIQDDLKMRAAIVSTALKAQQSRGWLIDLVDGAPEEAQPKLAPLRQRLEALLRG